jgi:hypothetical protein
MAVYGQPYFLFVHQDIACVSLNNYACISSTFRLTAAQLPEEE